MTDTDAIDAMVESWNGDTLTYDLLDEWVRILESVRGDQMIV